MVCYLKGTKVLTNLGYTLIEQLKTGDTIKIFGSISKIQKNITNYSEPIEEKITWIGKSKIVNPAQSDFPVCIKKDAIAPNVPCIDLRVSQNHMINYNGKYVKVSKLLNKFSKKKIFIDNKCEDLEYYHIITSKHKIINCNGILSETLGDINKINGFVYVD